MGSIASAAVRSQETKHAEPAASSAPATKTDDAAAKLQAQATRPEELAPFTRSETTMISVPIQQLPPKTPYRTYKFDKEEDDKQCQNTLNEMKYVPESDRFSEVLLSKWSDEDFDNQLQFKDNFLGAFLAAYNTHGEVTISPDDIWIMIMLYFAKYVNENAEALRYKIVSHEGKKQLVVREYVNSVQESLLAEKNWDHFFSAIIAQIDKNTKDSVVDKLKSDFSTTDRFHEMVSVATIMTAMKEYFSYGRMILGCGINAVHFRGGMDDWTHMHGKLSQLSSYDAGDGKLTLYVNRVGAILEKFVESMKEGYQSTFTPTRQEAMVTFQGMTAGQAGIQQSNPEGSEVEASKRCLRWKKKTEVAATASVGRVDVGWWNRIMTTEVKRIGSGGQTQTHLEGWILDFYGLHDQRIIVEDLDPLSATVPIKMYNEFTGVIKHLELRARFTGVFKVEKWKGNAGAEIGNNYAPRLGMQIVTRSSEPATDEKVNELFGSTN